MKLTPNKQGKLWINCASSVFVLPEFINLDNHIWLRLLPVFNVTKRLIPSRYHQNIAKLQEASDKAPLFQHDCTKPLPVADNSVDHILCSHFLEHVFPFEAEAIVADYYRVLKPGGTVHLIVPDLALQVENYQNQKANNPKAADSFLEEMLISRRNKPSWRFQLLGLVGNFGLDHKWMYDLQSLSELATAAGFRMVPENQTPSSQVRHNDGESAHFVGVKVS